MAPEPVPASTMMGAAASRRTSPSATSTTCSVSGRGMSTRPSTRRSSDRKAQWPRTYCKGSPRSPECRQGTGGVHVRCSDRLSVEGGRRAQHLLDDEPCLVAGAQRRGELSNQLAPCHGVPSPSPAS